MSVSGKNTKRSRGKDLKRSRDNDLRRSLYNSKKLTMRKRKGERKEPRRRG